MAEGVTLHFHYRGQTARWTERYHTEAEAIAFLARNPHLEGEQLVTPSTIYEAAGVEHKVNRFRAQTTGGAASQTFAEQRERAREAIDRARYERRLRAAEESIPGWGSFQ
jgi:hypothetical protein